MKLMFCIQTAPVAMVCLILPNFLFFFFPQGGAPLTPFHLSQGVQDYSVSSDVAAGSAVVLQEEFEQRCFFLTEQVL